MTLNTIEQAITLIKQSQKPLIIFKKDFSGDAVAASLALLKFFEKQGKQPQIVCSNFKPSDKFRFLPGLERIKDNLDDNKKFIISLPLNGKKIEEFSYDVVDDRLKIFISASQGTFSAQDLNVQPPSWDYDLIITLDTPDLEALGNIFVDNRDLFYDRPILNIDSLPNNEQYGQINLIDLTLASTCGVVYELLKATDIDKLDADINTCLLTGMVEKTKGFKAGIITPKTLRNSSELIENKARREEVIKHLYYDRDLATLKLWGIILTRLQATAGNKIVSATINLDDFHQTNTTTKNLPDVIDELISTVPGVEVIVLCYEKDQGKIGVLIKSLSNFDPISYFKIHQPVGTKILTKFYIHGNDLALAQSTIVDEINKALVI